MTNNQFSRTVLYIAFFLVLFYPFKGLISASLSLIIGADVSFTIVRSSIIFVLFFVSLNLLIYNITFLTKVDKILFFIGIFGFLIGIAKMDMNFLYNTTLLFGLPVAFAEFRKINDTHFFKFTFVFFSMSTIYMLHEFYLLFFILMATNKNLVIFHLVNQKILII